MNFIYKIMGVDKKPDDKYKYIWFTMGTACFALATLVMTIVISRRNTGWNVFSGFINCTVACYNCLF